MTLYAYVDNGVVQSVAELDPAPEEGTGWEEVVMGKTKDSKLDIPEDMEPKDMAETKKAEAEPKGASRRL